MTDRYDASDGLSLFDTWDTPIIAANGGTEYFPSYIGSLALLVAQFPDDIRVSFNGASFMPLPLGITLGDFDAPKGFWVKNLNAAPQSATFMFGRASISDNRVPWESRAGTTIFTYITSAGFNETLVHAGPTLVHRIHSVAVEGTTNHCRLFNKATAPVHNADLPFMQFLQPGNLDLSTGVAIGPFLFSNGLGFDFSKDGILVPVTALAGTDKQLLTIWYTPLN